MNFLSFLFGIMAFIVFWYGLMLLFGAIPAPFMGLLVSTSGHRSKNWFNKFILFPLALCLSFIFGIFIESLIYGGGLGLIALRFADSANHPLVYFIIAGFISFFVYGPHGERSNVYLPHGEPVFISGPHGERSFVLSIVSFLSYLLVVLRSKIATSLIGGGIIAVLDTLEVIIGVILGLSIIILISFLFLKGGKKIIDKF